MTWWRRRPALRADLTPAGGVDDTQPGSNGSVLEIRQLTTEFVSDDGHVRAVDGVSLSVSSGRTLCIVGESGCGKSVTARSVLQLVEPPGQIIGGHIWWAGGHAASADITALDPQGPEIRTIRGGEIGMVFQEPMASLSPMYTIGNQLTEAIQLHQEISKDAALTRAIEGLRRVGIGQPERCMRSYSFELSGGMCQRVMIAIALCCDPRLLIADEPTTALDVTTQARILDLIRGLQAETGMSIMFITHDMGVVAEIADDVAVMYLGRVVETGTVDDIFHDPKHPYTRALIRSIPSGGRSRAGRLDAITGTVPHPSERPPGCPFHPRCDQMISGVCDKLDPRPVEVGSGRRVSCVLYSGEVDSTAGR